MEEVEGEIEKDLSRKNRCFVTGGSGFIGFNLLLELLSQEWHVICLYYEGDKDIIKKRLFDLEEENKDNLQLVSGNILKLDSLRGVMPENVDAVFHIAGNIELDYRKNKFQTMINVDGTRNVLEIAIEKKVKRFIQASSCSVYGENKENVVMNEKSHKGAMEYGLNYGQSKYLGEQLVLEASRKKRIDAVILEPNFILGENDLLGQGFSLVYNKVFRKKLPLIPPGGGSFGDVKEVARAFISAYENGRNGECYILGGDFLTHKDFVAIIGKEMKMDKVPQYVPPKWLFYYIACILECTANCMGKHPKITTQQFMSTCRTSKVESTKAQKELGYKITPVVEIIRRQIKYMKEHNLFDRDISYD